MTTRSGRSEDDARWESVHVCPRCKHIINLSEIDLGAIATGIISCPRCGWSGSIEIQIVDGGESTAPSDRDHDDDG